MSEHYQERRLKSVVFQRFLLRSFAKGALKEDFAHKRYYPIATLSKALKGALGQCFAKKSAFGEHNATIQEQRYQENNSQKHYY